MSAPLPLRQPYRPANGTEGDMFRAAWCDRCHRDKSFQDGDGRGCGILGRSLLYNVGDPEYPKEWVYETDKEAQLVGEWPERPRCTAFAPLDGPAPGREAALKAHATMRARRACGDLFA